METSIEQIIAQNLIDLRKSKKLKQSELSEAIGYSDKTISRWENGSTMPDVSTLVKLAEFYNVSLEDLINENATAKAEDNKKSNNREDIINFYSMIGLGVLTIWTVATLIHVGLIMIKQVNFWQVYIIAMPVSSLLIYKYTRKNMKIKWFNFLMLSITICTSILFFYIAYLEYNFWQLFIVIVPLEGISVISSFFSKKGAKVKKAKSNNKLKD